MGFIEFILTFGAGVWLGWTVCDRIHNLVMADILKKAGVTDEDLKKQLKDIQAEMGQVESTTDLPVIEIKVEKHGDVLYAYRKDNDQFLGQGPDRDSLIEAMKQRMTNVTLSVVEGKEHLA